MRLYILRHGQTDLNSEKRFQGHMQTELNDVGIAQSEKVGELLRERGIKFDKIYCSPLERAIKTAEIATSETRDKFIIDDDLTEIDFGINEGNILAVSHGTAIHMMLLYMRGMEFSDLWTEHVGNCNVTVVDIEGWELKIRDDLQIETDKYVK